jgi:hypothetical protein
MRRISLVNLREATKDNQELWYNALISGLFDGSRMNLDFEDSVIDTMPELLPYLDKPSFPTFTEQLSNAVRAAYKVGHNVIHNLPVMVSDEKYNQRETICKSCEFYVDDKCSKCGCACKGKWINKLRYESESCPLNPPKW